MKRDDSAGKGHNSQRQAIVNALLATPDVQAVLRLTVLDNPEEKAPLVAATVSLVDTLPVYVVTHALDDARRRVRAVVGEDSEVFIEPDLVKDPNRVEPETDVIVIRASD